MILARVTSWGHARQTALHPAPTPRLPLEACTMLSAKLSSPRPIDRPQKQPHQVFLSQSQEHLLQRESHGKGLQTTARPTSPSSLNKATETSPMMLFP